LIPVFFVHFLVLLLSSFADTVFHFFPSPPPQIRSLILFFTFNSSKMSLLSRSFPFDSNGVCLYTFSFFLCHCKNRPPSPSSVSFRPPPSLTEFCVFQARHALRGSKILTSASALNPIPQGFGYFPPRFRFLFLFAPSFFWPFLARWASSRIDSRNGCDSRFS